MIVLILILLIQQRVVNVMKVVLMVVMMDLVTVVHGMPLTMVLQIVMKHGHFMVLHALIQKLIMAGIVQIVIVLVIVAVQIVMLHGIYVQKLLQELNGMMHVVLKTVKVVLVEHVMVIMFQAYQMSVELWHTSSIQENVKIHVVEVLLMVVMMVATHILIVLVMIAG